MNRSIVEDRARWLIGLTEINHLAGVNGEVDHGRALLARLDADLPGAALTLDGNETVLLRVAVVALPVAAEEEVDRALPGT